MLEVLNGIFVVVLFLDKEYRYRMRAVYSSLNQFLGTDFKTAKNAYKTSTNLN